MNKIICLKDYMPIKFRGHVLNGPFTGIRMNNSDLESIFAEKVVPPHMYAVNPNNKSEMIILNKDNYQLSYDELSGKSNVSENNEQMVEKEPEAPKDEAPKISTDSLKNLFPSLDDEKDSNADEEKSVEDSTDNTVTLENTNVADENLENTDTDDYTITGGDANTTDEDFEKSDADDALTMAGENAVKPDNTPVVESSSATAQDKPSSNNKNKNKNGKKKR